MNCSEDADSHFCLLRLDLGCQALSQGYTHLEPSVYHMTKRYQCQDNVFPLSHSIVLIFCFNEP